MKTAAILAAFALTASASASTTIGVETDYMSSGFFQSNFLRGDEADSTRSVNRATSESVFGVTGENTYFGFDFDPSQFTGPVSSAVFRVEIVANGFFADPTSENHAEISLHSLSADPLTSVDDSLAGGAGSWVEFRENEITTSSIVSTTSIDGLGIFEWDITDLVNTWIAEGDATFAYTIAASALLDPDADTAVGFVNSSYAGLGDELTAQIVVVPAPAALSLLIAGTPIATRRRRK